MPDQQYELVGVRSNVDRLSVESVHRLFSDMIERTVRSSREFLTGAVPHGETERLAAAVDSTGPYDEVDSISAAVGIPPIGGLEDRFTKTPSPDFFSPSGSSAADYPLFVDRGTGMFGPAHAPISSHTGGPLVWEEDGRTIFAQHVQGQEPHHFMLATYEHMTRVSLPADAAIFAEQVRHLASDPARTS